MKSLEQLAVDALKKNRSVSITKLPQILEPVKREIQSYRDKAYAKKLDDQILSKVSDFGRRGKVYMKY